MTKLAVWATHCAIPSIARVRCSGAAHTCAVQWELKAAGYKGGPYMTPKRAAGEREAEKKALKKGERGGLGYGNGVPIGNGGHYTGWTAPDSNGESIPRNAQSTGELTAGVGLLHLLTSLIGVGSSVHLIVR